jgi:hypothetical protein
VRKPCLVLLGEAEDVVVHSHVVAPELDLLRPGERAGRVQGLATSRSCVFAAHMVACSWPESPPRQAMSHLVLHVFEEAAHHRRQVDNVRRLVLLKEQAHCGRVAVSEWAWGRGGRGCMRPEQSQTGGAWPG